MIKVSALLLVCTLLIFFTTRLVSTKYGTMVASRFLEKSSGYTAETLQNWVTKNSEDARRYVIPVLFPLDLLFMSFLAATLAVFSTWLVQSIGWLNRFVWAVTLLPALYVTADLVEGLLLARLLTNPTVINHASVTITQVVTQTKILLFILALGQTGVLGIIALIFHRSI